MRPEQVRKELDAIIGLLIRVGFVDNFNFTSIRSVAEGVILVEYDGLEDISIALRDQSYLDSYLELLKRGQFTLKMLDGAILQMMYKFNSKGSLIKHRLSFMPSPINDEFQNDPEVYLEDQIYAEIVDRRILPVTMRFDYDPDNAVDIHHPHCHFTLGQYKNCRIAVNAPLSPSLFVEFILRSFYNTAFTNTVEIFNLELSKFEDTITAEERKRLHVNIS